MRTRNQRLESLRALRKSQRGMTLLEIMIVIAILGLLASVVVVAVMNQFENSKIKTRTGTPRTILATSRPTISTSKGTSHCAEPMRLSSGIHVLFWRGML